MFERSVEVCGYYFKGRIVKNEFQEYVFKWDNIDVKNIQYEDELRRLSTELTQVAAELDKLNGKMTNVK